MGYYFFLNRAVVLSNNKKQRTVSTSITKAKYIVLGHIARKAMWIKRFINKMQLEKAIKNLMLHGDNKMNIALTKNMESQHYIRHIGVQHHYIRELVNEGELTVK